MQQNGSSALRERFPRRAGNGSNLVNLLPSIPGKIASVGSMSIREGNKAGRALFRAFVVFQVLGAEIQAFYDSLHTNLKLCPSDKIGKG